MLILCHSILDWTTSTASVAKGRAHIFLLRGSNAVFKNYEILELY